MLFSIELQLATVHYVFPIVLQGRKFEISITQDVITLSNFKNNDPTFYRLRNSNLHFESLKYLKYLTGHLM